MCLLFLPQTSSSCYKYPSVPSFSRSIFHPNTLISNLNKPLKQFSNQNKPDQTKSSTMADSLKNAANYVGDKFNEATAGASKEANKNVAKDSNASLGTRAEAAKDAASDKIDESKNSASAEGNKQAATH
ncbi:hypothetical protein PV10_05709 [Exophiala mesophila]|uniref:Glucose-repressible protein n=1 Tax=Exophiala mesophila TaxID=212818 RepID=A0A0D1ZWG1_EXOME|nr:uncharacterized protein PV10_05709 [Exophiala mesophila]KIV91133.1 hypothetical protein PV10_05709 [Exophiala mesophila]